MKIYNTALEVEADLNSIKDNKAKFDFLLDAYNLRSYVLRKALNVTELTDTRTGVVNLGMHLFDEKVIELSLKNDEVLRFIEIELEYIQKITKPFKQSEFQSLRNMQMSKLDEFLIEIQTLDIKGDQYLSLAHYNQHHSDYESNLKRLQQLALNELLLLMPEQIRLQLTRFQQIHERFTKFWEVYKQLFAQFKESKLQLIDLELKLYPLFIVPKHPASIISEQFLFDLHDAVMFKQGFFEGFEAQVQKVLNEHKTEFQFTYEQEVTEERKQNLQKQLDKLKTNDEKISFLINEKAKYLQNVPPRTLEVSGSVHANFAPGAELFFDKYIQIEIDRLESLRKNHNTEYTHREYILANIYKAKAGIESEKTAKQWKEERGAKGYQQYYTLLKMGKNYKPPTVEELTNVIELLKHFPEAQKIAINKKEELQSL